jgi:hypothetical protein
MPEQREQFRQRVEELVAGFEGGVDRHEWVTRRYPKRLKDDDRQVFEVPALYLHEGKRGQEPLCEAPSGPFRQRFLTRFPARAFPSSLLPTSLGRPSRDDRRCHRDLVILAPGRPDGPPQLAEVGIEVLDS